ncbi:hypothetical protein [Corynebacterium kalidii]|uniref:Uncharacterized protein n=1 Tax=Corynebacterium kalidii TaxID=2931982 RepID=A0A9X1WG31_9CORY|nr:hypothetical protein [Corynebacterium kalidii]MCJ7858384.1 hypothetical protein [Corynebacterium kalidii]
MNIGTALGTALGKCFSSPNGFFSSEVLPRRSLLFLRDRHIRIGLFLGALLAVLLMLFSRGGNLDVARASDTAKDFFQVSVPTTFTAAAIILSVVGARLLKVLSQPSENHLKNRPSKFDELAFAMLWAVTCNVLSFFTFLVFSTSFNESLRFSMISWFSLDFLAVLFSCVLVTVSFSMLMNMVDVVMQVAKYALKVEMDK